jgi:hypothetical protein
MASNRRRGKDYEPIGVAHVGTLLAEALRDPARIRAALGVWPAWEQAVGPQVAAAAHPISLKEGVLLVHVRHSVWLQELQQQKDALLRRVQALPGGVAVKDLRLRVAPKHEAERFVPERREPAPAAPIPYEVARIIRGIESSALRGAMIRVAAKWSGLIRSRGESR